MKCDIKDTSLAQKGMVKIEWAERDMPVLSGIASNFKKTKPFKNITIGACLHVTAETANLMIALKNGGAKVGLCASNPLSTQDDVAAALVKNFQIPVFAKKGENQKEYFAHLHSVLDMKPNITMDDGADLVSELHSGRLNQAKKILGGTEETTTGVSRLKSMAQEGTLLFPVIAVNDSMTKHFFDNRYGTGQSTMDGIIRATNKLIAGSVFVIAGYGWCGKGLAMRARGMGANVIITEIDPVKAIEALMDGFRVMPMTQAAKEADFICTVTGNINVVGLEAFKVIKDGCVISNSGHFDVEIDLVALRKITKKRKVLRDFVESYKLKNGKTIFVLAGGRLVNLGSAEGHPASVMDMSFANQILAVEFILRNGKKLSNSVHVLPEILDRKIATLKLRSLGTKIDTLSERQKKYMAGWREGTR
ncbi:MAG: Adenosylhomocysteinase [Candidatus Nomurabacteria bacterium GW2011_GWC2_41_8]|uniref:Adenosylhomocysteinase n=2 Tax=Candidatus Nomuraibacteriota TaxID=1752729 RepID=A0A1F6YDM0_9BACT|nr:MAG: Adenosylhomocysteinase [Candidatus Nomurabacteria bacterium GW2011_GWC2_41_8]OGI67070.1 MAG: adenosylhomocysteinase [Candidatus Nomurabacteria bacterium RIFCSPHIGHO2_01_FULL_41_91]OGI80113.1 MAG: adenosylhomocysteinase [Candidatus Nomurabacteria bacterium RIFCSPHIGHO2_02_FULL_41_52]OGI84472.1 MAG: adenosylhomocysteinase [Candidatus Nomurabacteria bacterium RIFCSPHIGHO2_12_FULL_42_19]OGI93683.1 MAG: adenosylhomocysteinase [Candidatus Nomurabacteria bacterium RIFCSPLOWO2_01_FULL_41_52]OG